MKVEGKEFEAIAVEGEPIDVAQERSRTYGDMESVLRIYNLCKVYKGLNGQPDHTAVHNLTFSVNKGECFGFLV
jgi:hypothetical protein